MPTKPMVSQGLDRPLGFKSRLSRICRLIHTAMAGRPQSVQNLKTKSPITQVTSMRQKSTWNISARSFAPRRHLTIKRIATTTRLE